MTRVCLDPLARAWRERFCHSAHLSEWDGRDKQRGAGVLCRSLVAVKALGHDSCPKAGSVSHLRYPLFRGPALCQCIATVLSSLPRGPPHSHLQLRSPWPSRVGAHKCWLSQVIFSTSTEPQGKSGIQTTPRVGGVRSVVAARSHPHQHRHSAGPIPPPSHRSRWQSPSLQGSSSPEQRSHHSSGRRHRHPHL